MRTHPNTKRFHTSIPALAILAALALTMAAPAAAVSPLYAVVKLGNTSTDLAVESEFQALIDGDDNSWAAGFGIHIRRWVAFQLEYHDLGSVSGVATNCPPSAGPVCLALSAPVSADITALSLSVMPQVNVTERVGLYGKAGVIAWEASVDDLVLGGGSVFSTDFDSEELLLGAGVRVKLPGPFGAFAEFERLGDLFETVAVGVTLGF